MSDFSKSEKKSLRELASTVYEAEARLALDDLDANFDQWRQGSVLGSELIAAIHEFDLVLPLHNRTRSIRNVAPVV